MLSKSAVVLFNNCERNIFEGVRNLVEMNGKLAQLFASQHILFVISKSDFEGVGSITDILRAFYIYYEKRNIYNSRCITNKFLFDIVCLVRNETCKIFHFSQKITAKVTFLWHLNSNATNLLIYLSVINVKRSMSAPPPTPSRSDMLRSKKSCELVIHLNKISHTLKDISFTVIEQIATPLRIQIAFFLRGTVIGRHNFSP